jgi:hypothetical protein
MEESHMKKTQLETAIEQAAATFALEIVNAVKGSTLQELIALQGGEDAAPPARKKPGPKPGRKKTGPKPGRKKTGPKPGRKKTGPKPGRKKPGPKPGRKKVAVKAVPKAVRKPALASKKRVVRNYPKCAYPGCENNRFVRGKGFCGEHWRLWKAGKIKSAEKYKK